MGRLLEKILKPFIKYTVISVNGNISDIILECKPKATYFHRYKLEITNSKCSNLLFDGDAINNGGLIQTVKNRN